MKLSNIYIYIYENQQVEVWILGSQNSNLNFSIIKNDQNLNKKTTGCMLS